MAKTTDTMKIIDNLIGDDAPMREMLAEASFNAEVGQLIYDARQKSGLTQQQLAELIGTTKSVIDNLEEADYEGNSLIMLHKIGIALKQKLTLNLAPLEDNPTKEPISC
ncbi:MAG: helix-turn-helix domain-containing protein [Waterburya sp.]